MEEKRGRESMNQPDALNAMGERSVFHQNKWDKQHSTHSVQ